MIHLDYHRPQSLQEACRLREQLSESLFIAGGTDLMVRLKIREVRPPALISLRAIPGLSGVLHDAGVRLGALTTIADLIRDQRLGRDYPVLVAAARRLGSAQIRNAATVGGNLCNASPCADCAVALLALEAQLEIQGSGEPRVVSLAEFFQGPGQTCLGPGEVLSAIRLAPPRPAQRGVFLKKGRVRMDLALASVALVAQLSGDRCLHARLAAGSVAPTPIRLPEVERVLQGAVLDDAVLAEAARLASTSVSPIDDIRASADYRRRLIGVYVRRSLESLRGRSAA